MSATLTLTGLTAVVGRIGEYPMIVIGGLPLVGVWRNDRVASGCQAIYAALNAAGISDVSDVKICFGAVADEFEVLVLFSPTVLSIVAQLGPVRRAVESWYTEFRW